MPSGSISSVSFRKLVAKINYLRLQEGRKKLSAEKIAEQIIKTGGKHLENELIQF